MGSFRDDASYPSSLAETASNNRPSSAIRLMTQLRMTTPKVVLLPETEDPGCYAVKPLLQYLTSDYGTSTWKYDKGGIQKATKASCCYTTELRSEGSWVMDVVRPLLNLVIDDLPLESWGVYITQDSSVSAIKMLN